MTALLGRPRASLGWTLLAFAAVRLVTVATVAVLRPEGSPLLPAKGDIAWYVEITEIGYVAPDWVNPGMLAPSNMAFFPLFPGLARPLTLLGIPSIWALAIVAVVASFFAAWAIFRIGERLRGPRVGMYLACAWGCFWPTSIALSLPLSESTYTALAAWALLLMLRRQLVPAGIVTAVAGLSRPTAVVLILPLAWVVVARLRERHDVAQAIVAAVIAPLGLLAFVGFVGARVGRPDGYLWVQQSFRSTVDFGASWFRALWDLVTSGAGPIHNMVTVATVAAIAVLCMALVRERPPAELLLFTAGSLLLIVIQSNHLTTVQRFIVPVFPLLIPIAAVLSRLRWPLAAGIIAVVTVLTAWYGAYLLYEARIFLV